MADQGPLADLQELAEAALVVQDNPEAQLTAIETYCEAFAKAEQAGSLADLEAGEEAEILSKLHEKVLMQAAVLLDDTARDMQHFKKKARGIMAYVDTMPKKISVTKSKKG